MAHGSASASIGSAPRASNSPTSSTRPQRQAHPNGPLDADVDSSSYASLVRVVLVAGVVAFAVGPQVVPAQEVGQSPEARARAFIDLMAGGQYAQALGVVHASDEGRDACLSRWKLARLRTGPMCPFIRTTASTTCLWPGPARACRPNTTRRAMSARPSYGTSRRGSWRSPRDAGRTRRAAARHPSTLCATEVGAGFLRPVPGVIVSHAFTAAGPRAFAARRVRAPRHRATAAAETPARRTAAALARRGEAGTGRALHSHSHQRSHREQFLLSAVHRRSRLPAVGTAAETLLASLTPEQRKKTVYSGDEIPSGAGG